MTPEEKGQLLLRYVRGRKSIADLDFRGALLPRGLMMFAQLTGGRLEDANLRRAQLLRANLTDAVLARCQLQGANLEGACLCGADLSRAELSEAVLQNADLSGAELAGADLQSADLRGATLTDTQLDGALYSDRTSWPEGFAVPDGARFIGEETDLRGADLTGAFLLGADLHSAQICGADLTDANLQGADLQEADLRRARLRRANLLGAFLWKATLEGADLQDASLQGVDLRGVQLGETNLRGADLRGADLRNANLRDANLRGTRVDGATIDIDTYIRSGWSPATCGDLARRGAIVFHLHRFPVEVRAAALGDGAGLVLYQAQPLDGFDEHSLLALAYAVLGSDSDLRISERVQDPVEGGGRIRLMAGARADLERVAETLASGGWRTPTEGLVSPELIAAEQITLRLARLEGHREKIELWWSPDGGALRGAFELVGSWGTAAAQ